jgi:hypothetical protein
VIGSAKQSAFVPVVVGGGQMGTGGGQLGPQAGAGGGQLGPQMGAGGGQLGHTSSRSATPQTVSYHPVSSIVAAITSYISSIVK